MADWCCGLGFVSECDEAVGKLEQRPTWSDWSALVVPGCRCWWRSGMGLNRKQVHSQAGAKGACSRVAKRCDNRLYRGQLFLLLSLALASVSLRNPSSKHTQQVSRLDAPCCLHVKPQDRHLLLEALCGNAGLEPSWR